MIPAPHFERCIGIDYSGALASALDVDDRKLAEIEGWILGQAVRPSWLGTQDALL